MAVPDLPTVQAYLSDSGLTYDDTVVSAALAAEMAAQDRVVKVGDYPADIAEALMRRVARNLAARSIPLGVQAQEFGAMYVGSNDPEVRRLEAPHRKWVVA